MELRIDVPSAQAISAAYLQAPAMVLDELTTAMELAVSYLQRETQDRTPTAAGILRDSFVTQVGTLAQLGAVFGRVSSPLTYAVPVELGTRPHYPPLEPLINWVEQKLDLYGDEAEAAARGIQRKIGQRGSIGHGMAHFALRDGRETVLAEFAEAAQRIKARLAAAGKGSAA